MNEIQNSLSEVSPVLSLESLNFPLIARRSQYRSRCEPIDIVIFIIQVLENLLHQIRSGINNISNSWKFDKLFSCYFYLLFAHFQQKRKVLQDGCFGFMLFPISFKPHILGQTQNIHAIIKRERLERQKNDHSSRPSENNRKYLEKISTK